MAAAGAGAAVISVVVLDLHVTRICHPVPLF
jgi:hypothetical protein